jgi:sugar phosphate isomerase/epimerase
MTTPITRRTAFAVGGAAAGALIGGACAKQEQPAQQTTQTIYPPFLTPWSPELTTPRNINAGTTPIRLCSWRQDCTLDYPTDGTPITQLVKRIKDQGFSAGNAYNAPGTKNPWLAASNAEVKELKDACAQHDVLFFDMHTVAYNIHPDPEVRKQNIRYVIESCEAAERVGCPMVTTHTGTKSTISQVAPDPKNWTWETWKESVASIKEILNATTGMKVELGIEAVNMTLMNNPRAHKQLMEDVGDPRCKVLLDPINMIHMGNYFRTTELINECFDLLGEKILAAHAKDTYVLPDRMSMYITEVAAGKGMLDYELYLASLSRLSWPRPLLIEHLPFDEYDVARKFIEDTAARIGVKFYGRA